MNVEITKKVLPHSFCNAQVSLPLLQQIVLHLPFPSHLALSLKSGKDQLLHNQQIGKSACYSNCCKKCTGKKNKNKNKGLPEVTDLAVQLWMMQIAVAADFE